MMSVVLRRFRKTLQYGLLTLLIVAFAHALTWGVGKISLLDSLEHSVLDFDFTDIYYSGGYRPSPIDTNIILVNIGPLGKSAIARQIEILSQFNPKVIGVDVFFSIATDSAETAYLWQVIKSTPNIVLPSRLFYLGEDSPSPDSVILPSDVAGLSADFTGYANLNVPDDDPGLGTIRSFISSAYIKDKYHFPFAAVLAKNYDPLRFDSYLKRNQQNEQINFTGHRLLMFEGSISDATYITIDYLDVLENNIHENLIRDKIVLLGYMGNHLYDQSPEDKFYSPMNERFAGRSLPDMYGVEVQANMASMILSGNYINQSKLLDRFLDLFLLLMAIIIFRHLFIKSEEDYSFTSKIVVFVMINLMVIVPLLIYHYFLFKIDLRYGIFYLIFASDLFEVLYPKIKRIKFLAVAN
ncbi:MAG: CHASE2 domain-containing protein [Cyclobacteriaceae bacterium]|nr:CHASE2 domain-containing protein [Cyclobacteriaceae bacterium]UYN87185.1 MAG: CHASE2 domain-containing protein [Cyclobacteriaceae bacterium]